MSAGPSADWVFAWCEPYEPQQASLTDVYGVASNHHSIKNNRGDLYYLYCGDPKPRQHRKVTHPVPKDQGQSIIVKIYLPLFLVRDA